MAAIGDFRNGGVVFWVDPADNTKGKVCALADAPSSLSWQAAIRYCNAYTNPDTGTGVHSDWYLPSKDELQLMYANLQRFGCSTNTPGGTDLGICRSRIGNFEYFFYWSSTEGGFFNAWAQDFDNGGRDDLDWCADRLIVARAVRAF